MKIRLWVSLIVMLLWAVIVDAAEPQDTLLDLLSNPNCTSACWLGIDIGMPETEMLEILNTNNILYEKGTVGGPDGVVSYVIKDGYTHPYIYPGASVFIFLDREDRVGTTFITLNNIFISDVIAAYGLPTHILDERGNISLAYLSEGLVFLVESDGSSIYEVDIQTEQKIIEAYINDPFSKEMTPCVDTTPLCAVATATSTPNIPLAASLSSSILPTSTLTPIPSTSSPSRLFPYVTSERCDQACFLGIEPGTTQEQVKQILDEARLPYEAYSYEDRGDIYNIVIDNSTQHTDYPFRNVMINFLGASPGVVAHVSMLIDETPFEDIQALFGAPEMITTLYGSEFYLLYPSQGILFASGELSPERDTVGFVQIMPAEDMMAVYGSSNSLDSLPACEYAALCALATATPVPK